MGDGKGVKRVSPCLWTVGRQESDPQIGRLVVDSEMQEGSNPREGCLYEKYAIFTEEIKTDCSLLRLQRYKRSVLCPGRPAGSYPIHLLEFLRSQRLFYFPFLLFLPSEGNTGCRTGRMEEGEMQARIARTTSTTARLPDSATPHARTSCRDFCHTHADLLFPPRTLTLHRIMFSHRFHE